MSTRPSLKSSIDEKMKGICLDPSRTSIFEAIALNSILGQATRDLFKKYVDSQPRLLHKATVCTGCGKNLNSTGDGMNGRTPAKGDFSVCLHCGKIHKFNDDLTMIECSEEELKQLSLDPDASAYIDKIRREIEKKRKRK